MPGMTTNSLCESPTVCTVLFFKWIAIFVDLHFWKKALFCAKCWNFISLYSDENGLYRYIVNYWKYDQVMKFLLIPIFGEKKWNYKAYLSYRQYGEILQIFMNELQFTFGKFWGAFTCFTVLKTQDYDQIKILLNRNCHEKIQFTNFESPNFQHFFVEIQHEIL